MRERVLGGLGFLAVVALGVGLLGRLAPPVVAYAAFNLPGTAAEQLAAAAGALDAALAKGGSGITFQAVQRTTEYAKPDGPRIGLTAPEDPRKVIAEVDEYYIGGITSRGALTDTAFWMDMRLGPAKDKAADAAGPLVFRVLERDGALWRDDGDGWYGIKADESPGTGMDPTSARLLPTLLRSMSDVRAIEPTLVDGQYLVGARGIAQVDDYPGVLAADGKAFTEGTFEITYWLDERGRLARLETRVRNLLQPTYDLVSETLVTFGYGATGDPPEPTPTMAPRPLPTSEPGSIQVGS